MYRAIANFDIGNTHYDIGENIADSDNEAVQNDAHLRKFVVLLTSAPPPQFPSPNP